MCLTTNATFVKISDILLCVLDSVCSGRFHNCTDILFSHTRFQERGWAGLKIEYRKREGGTSKELGVIGQQLGQHIAEREIKMYSEQFTLDTHIWDMTKCPEKRVSSF